MLIVRIARYKGNLMDFQKIVDSIFSTSCILSVENKAGGVCGEIRIVAGNKKFAEVAENPPFVPDKSIPLPKFEPDSIYDKYLPKTPDFEDKCYQSAVLKKTIHTYIHLNICDLWFNMLFWPLDYEEGDLSDCVYSTDPCDIKDIDMNASGPSKISDDVLKTCIKLRGTNEFNKTLDEVIKDIRELCGAEVCTLLLVDQEQGTSTTLARSKASDSTIKTILQYPNMYDIAMSWVDTIGERDCIIVRNDKDLEYVKEGNYPWYQTLEESKVRSIVVFPLRHSGELLGFIWATNFDVENT